MRPWSEYTQEKWRVEGQKIVIKSGKGGKMRAVPLVFPPIPAELTASGFRKAMAQLDVRVCAYDARRTYANWLESAGVIRSRRKLYLGHGPSDVTDLYEWHQVDQFVVEDAEKLRAFMGTEDRKLRLM